MSNYYGVLGITQDATQLQIKKAFRQLALQWHPDKVPAHFKETATKKFQEIGTAYEVLNDPAARATYDQELAKEKTNGSTKTSFPDINPNMTNERILQFLNELTKELKDAEELGMQLAEETSLGIWAQFETYASQGCNFNIKYHGNNVIHYAVFQNRLKELERLLTLRFLTLTPLAGMISTPNINSRNHDGLTALQIAVNEGNIEVVKCLLSHNAQLTWWDRNGDTALHLAIKKSDSQNSIARNTYSNIAKLLIQNHKIEGTFGYISNQMENNKKETPLFLSISLLNYDVAYELFRFGVKVDSNSHYHAMMIPVIPVESGISKEWKTLAQAICDLYKKQEQESKESAKSGGCRIS